MNQSPAPHDRAAAVKTLAGDGLIVAARLIVTHGLLAERAAGRGDLAQVFAGFRAVDSALQEARDIVAMAGRIAK